jgi:hypothetical protein
LKDLPEGTAGGAIIPLDLETNIAGAFGAFEDHSEPKARLVVGSVGAVICGPLFCWIGERSGRIGRTLNIEAAGAGDRKPSFDTVALIRTGDSFSEKRGAWLAGVGEAKDIPSSLMDMEELNERSTSMGKSVSVPVGDGGEEGNAEMV